MYPQHLSQVIDDYPSIFDQLGLKGLRWEAFLFYTIVFKTLSCVDTG